MFVWRRLKAHLGLVMLLLLGQATAFAEDFLPPEQAFAFSYATQTDGSVKLHWDIAPGYHLYRDRIAFEAKEPDATWDAATLPQATDLFDANFGKNMAVYTQPIDVVFLDPEQRITDQELANFIASIIEDIRSPIGMFAQSWVGMFIEMRAVKEAQTVCILREMGRHRRNAGECFEVGNPPSGRLPAEGCR